MIAFYIAALVAFIQYIPCFIIADRMMPWWVDSATVACVAAIPPLIFCWPTTVIILEVLHAGS